MKKLFLLMMLMTICVSSFSQQLNGFMGIPFGTPKAELKEKFMAKNQTATIYTDKPDILTFENARFGGRNAIAIIFAFTNDGKFHTGIALLENETEDMVFNMYDEIVQDVNTKYHYRDDKLDYWAYPYSASDRYNHGVTAMKLGKCKLQSIWRFDVNDPSSTEDDNVISVETTKSCNIKVAYQNGIMINQVLSSKKEKDSQDY